MKLKLQLPEESENKAAKLAAFLEGLSDVPDGKNLSRETISDHI